MALALLLIICSCIGLALQRALLALPFGVIPLALLASTLLAQRSLHEHVAKVAQALDNSLEQGRAAVAKIVGRDVTKLDEAGVARAAIESLAENFSDGIVAPALWMAAFGLPGALCYKAINTADSMIGHRDDALSRLRLRGGEGRRSRQPAGLASRGGAFDGRGRRAFSRIGAHGGANNAARRA